MKLPKAITFTGIDENTDFDRCNEISVQYHKSHNIIVEWGVLHSLSRMNIVEEKRYPDFETMMDIFESINRHYLAAHICGTLANNVMTGVNKLGYYEKHFNTVQVNHSNPDYDTLEELAMEANVNVVGQVRGSFPRTTEIVQRLFDMSGGTGLKIEEFPMQLNPHNFVGYAGGINPENVLDVIEKIETKGKASYYWIDMESGVRTNDVFDLDKCLSVLEKVYK